MLTPYMVPAEALERGYVHVDECRQVSKAYKPSVLC